MFRSQSFGFHRGGHAAGRSRELDGLPVKLEAKLNTDGLALIGPIQADVQNKARPTFLVRPLRHGFLLLPFGVEPAPFIRGKEIS
jgi:hypothetical protein